MTTNEIADWVRWGTNPERTRFKRAYWDGQRSALLLFKVAGALGADVGVAPRGPEVSHGTQRTQYALRGPQRKPDSEDLGSSAEANQSDWLWDNFTAYDGEMAPGRADGSYGQEVIG